MEQQPLYKALSRSLQAYQSCQRCNNEEWIPKHKENLDRLVDLLPSGSGIDSGTKLDLERSNPDRLVLTFGFHHLNEGGYYDGWTEHEAIITPSLAFDFTMRITGRNRNAIKDYLYETYWYELEQRVDLYQKTEVNSK